MPDVSVTAQVMTPRVIVPSMPLQLTLATPDNASLTVPEIVSAALDTVAPFAGEVIVRVGGVLYNLTGALPVAVLPALSVAVPLITCPAVSVLTAAGDEHVLIPLSASE